MDGLHLTADLHQCQCDTRHLCDAEAIGADCLAAVQASGLRPVAQLFHAFAPTGAEPAGVTVAILLAESHLCLHTWPERQGVTLDVYVCNYGDDHSAKAHALMEALIALFQPGLVERHALQRGGATKPA